MINSIQPLRCRIWLHRRETAWSHCMAVEQESTAFESTTSTAFASSGQIPARSAWGLSTAIDRRIS